MLRKINHVNFMVILTIAFPLTACDGGKMPEKISLPTEVSKIDDSAWKALSEKRILFGHQSVGDNIIDGVQDLRKKHSRIQLDTTKLKKPLADIQQPGFYHFHVGQNTNPKSKIDDFRQWLENGMGDKIDIAFFKFCYIDVNPSSNVVELFQMYQSTLSSLKEKYPEVKFVHVTMPLVKLQDGPKAWIKKLIGKPISGLADNMKRDEFNRLLLSAYAGKEPVYDLAKAESTYPNGTRSVMTSESRDFYTLVPDYTDDGEHLNATGRQAAASELLRVLATVSGGKLP
jgi:hypothetical protein